MLLTSLYIGLIFLFAGFVQGLTGFGSILVAAPLLCLIIDIKAAVPLCMLSSVVITSVLTFQLKQQCDYKKIAPLCIGTLPGIAFGVTILASMHSGTIRFFLGLLLILYSLYSLLFTLKPRNLHQGWSLLAGFLSGAIGAAFGTGGPPTIIYTTLNNWKKDEVKATLTSFFLFNSLIISITHAISGLTTKTVFTYFLTAAPFILIGTLAGSRLYRFLTGEKYIKLIFFFLIVMGILMITGK